MQQNTETQFRSRLLRVDMHLRCNVVAAIALKDALDRVLLLATPTPEGKAH
jgi:hypothetical protein